MSTHWVITDYERNISFWEDLLKEKKIKYFGYAEENCPSTGRPHWQAFCITGRKEERPMQRMVKPRHVEIMRGSLMSNDIYCSKQNRMKHLGIRPSNGNSANVLAAKMIIDGGGTISDLYDEGFQLSAIRWGEGYISRKRKREEFQKPKVTWIYGETGTGKSRMAYEMTDDPWVSSADGLQWFDGYEHNEDVIFDDFRASHCSFSRLLRLLDGYGMRVPIKGGFVNWMPKQIVITSCYSPEECYCHVPESLQQLLRRIDTIIEKKCTT